MAAAHCTNEARSLIVPQGWPIAKKREIVITAISHALAERIANQGVHRSIAPRSNVTISAREAGPESGESTCPLPRFQEGGAKRLSDPCLSTIKRPVIYADKSGAS